MHARFTTRHRDAISWTNLEAFALELVLPAVAEEGQNKLSGHRVRLLLKQVQELT